MYVSVKYFKDDAAGYAGKDYTYATALDLKPGDRVKAPTFSGLQRAMVVAVGLDKPPFDCREIVERDEGGAKEVAT